MFYDSALNHRINSVPERALGIAYKDTKNDFGSLPEQNNSVTIHGRNLQLLMTDILKAKCDFNPPFMKDIFMERSTGFNPRHGNDAQLPEVRTKCYGVETICYFGNRQ